VKPEISEDDDEFPSFFSESDYNFYNLLTVLNTMYNEDPKSISRTLINTMNTSFLLYIAEEELRGIQIEQQTDY